MASSTIENDSGLGAWGKAYFIEHSKAYADSAGSHIPVANGDENAGMTEEDLGAIFSFLRTLEPVKNIVERRMVESNGK